MPPVTPCGAAPALQRAAAELGWPAFAVPLLINTTPYLGRPACTQCQHCVGFACPVDAKNGSQNTMLVRALASGNCTLVTHAQVDQVTVTPTGRVNGVRYYDAAGQQHNIQAEQVVVAAGAIETARLLLNSRSTAHRDGLGNAYDQVGRHLQGHYYPRVAALMPESVYDGIGPGVSIATTAFNHGNDGIIGGGMLANDFIVLPIIFWRGYMPPEIPRWGSAAKAFMRENYQRVTHVMGPVQDIPSPLARVTLDPQVRDRYGMPVARLSGTTHPETVRAAEFMWQRAREWLTAAGAERTWGTPPGLSLSGGQHQAGTCRMGEDPRTSVTDHWGRVHGHDNLFVADASLHVTNGGFNPVLTVLALAFRVARRMDAM
ncbi:MAG TPA: GMC family oxidoreductase [Roseiflexaceae bacterium]|nr:GMC family oxidoreductase [Roseiflexaceae bacterium]